MSEVTPTMENLTDPYVLQLIEALAKQDDEIEHLTADIQTANDAWDAASIENERLTGDLLDAREEYKQRQEWAAKQSMEVISRLQARVEALEAVKEAAQEALECLYFHSFEPGEDPRISNLAGAMLVADGTLAATEQEGK